MASTKVLQRSFTGGEVSPQMYGRIDDAKYQAGLEICRNFVVLPQGPVENRAVLPMSITQNTRTKSVD